MEQKVCPSKRESCPRHGDCEELENCPTVGMILADNPGALKNLNG